MLNIKRRIVNAAVGFTVAIVVSGLTINAAKAEPVWDVISYDSYDLGYQEGYNAKQAYLQKSMTIKKIISVEQTIQSDEFWDNVYELESRSGKNMILPRKKYKTCVWTSDPCGALQIARGALKDLNMDTKVWRTRRMSFEWSKVMAKKYVKLVYDRLPNNYKKQVVTELDMYHLHQQSNNGFIMKTNLANGVDVKKGLGKYAKSKISSKYILKALYRNIPKSKRKEAHTVVIKKHKGKRIKTYVINDNVVHVFDKYWKQKWLRTASLTMR